MAVPQERLDWHKSGFHRAILYVGISVGTDIELNLEYMVLNRDNSHSIRSDRNTGGRYRYRCARRMCN